MTPTATPPTVLPPFEPSETRRFTADEFRRMFAAGVLPPGEQAALVDGYVVSGRANGNGHPTVTAADLRPFTVAEYHRLIAADILTPDDEVELLDGYVVTKMPQGAPHGDTVTWLIADLTRLVPPGWQVRPQVPVTLDTSEPEPDAAVVRGGRRAFVSRHPGPADIGLLAEVSASSLAHDRARKAELYAAAGIPVYWVVNVDDLVIEVYADPDPAAAPPAYRTRTDHRPGDAVPVVLDGVEVGRLAAADLLP